MTYKTLFELSTQIYKDNFVKWGGLDVLERLQSDGVEEIYELARKLMEEHFADHIEVEEIQQDQPAAFEFQAASSINNSANEAGGTFYI